MWPVTHLKSQRETFHASLISPRGRDTSAVSVSSLPSAVCSVHSFIQSFIQSVIHSACQPVSRAFNQPLGPAAAAAYRYNDVAGFHPCLWTVFSTKVVIYLLSTHTSPWFSTHFPPAVIRFPPLFLAFSLCFECVCKFKCCTNMKSNLHNILPSVKWLSILSAKGERNGIGNGNGNGNARGTRQNGNGSGNGKKPH